MSARLLTHIILILAVACIGCKKKPVGPQCDTCDTLPVVSYKDVIIGCEGNFGWGNASLSLYNPETNTVNNSVFTAVNGISLGDVLQSLTLINGRLYAVVNNSGRIVVLDTANYILQITMTGFVSPRYIVGNEHLAFVSDLYAKKVYQIDLNTHTIMGNYQIDNWTEGMLLEQNRLWVTCPDTNYCIRINLQTNQLEDTVHIGKGVNKLVKDKNGSIWGLSTGGFEEEIPQLVRINSTGAIEQRFYFPSVLDYPTQLTIDETGEQLYFLNKDCFRMSISAGSLPSLPIVAAGQRIFYGLGVCTHGSSTTEIYLADALDYVQPGVVYRYSVAGELLDQFSVGIIPQAFWFKP
jgi:hypothetical protein